jgi:hypothetical protein
MTLSRLRMTRWGWILSVLVGLGTVLASGCTHTWFDRVQPPSEPRREADAGPAGSALAGSPYHPVAAAPGVPETKPDAAVERVRFPEPPRVQEGPAVKPPPAPVETSEAAAAEPAKPAPETTAREDEPLVKALRCFLDKQPANAVEILQGYDRANQELLLSLLPLAVRLTESSVDRVEPLELTNLIDQLHSLSLPLQRRAGLRIARLCFCKDIKGFGMYDPLPEDQAVFQGGSDGHAGEAVQVYVEMRNFHSEAQGIFALIRLKSALQIRNYQGKVVWEYDKFPDKDFSRTPRQDYFINYKIYVPAHLAPGSYTLVVQVQDVLAQPLRPPAMRSLEFRVNANGAAQAPRGGPGMASSPGGGGL